MTKESNPSELSALKAIVYELQAEVRSLKVKVQEQKLTKNQVALQEAEVRSLRAEVQQLTKHQVAIQEEIQKLTAANQNQNAANVNGQDNRDESKDETVANENNNGTTVAITNTIIETPTSNHISYRSDNDNDAAADDANKEENLKRYLFTKSLHKYLFMDTIECSNDRACYRVGLHHKVIANAVIGFHFFSYFVFGLLQYRDYQKGLDGRMTPRLHAVSPKVCYDTEAFPNDDPIWGHYAASWNNGTYSDLGQAMNTFVPD